SLEPLARLDIEVLFGFELIRFQLGQQVFAQTLGISLGLGQLLANPASQGRHLRQGKPGQFERAGTELLVETPHAFYVPSSTLNQSLCAAGDPLEHPSVKATEEAAHLFADLLANRIASASPSTEVGTGQDITDGHQQL